MTLTEFLLARIAEREAVARAAADGDPEWEFRETAWSSWNVEARGRNGNFYSVTCDSEGLSDSVLTHDVGHHIALNHPAYVLAECEAKRRIVDYREQAARSSRDTGLPIFEAQAGAYDASLRALALPYADHPDYREEFRP